MNAAERAERPSVPRYSARLVRPFVSAVRPSGAIPEQWLSALDALDLDFRIPVPVAHQMLEIAIDATGDDALGLRAARESTPGNTGAFSYMVSSAPTVRGAIDVAARYARLVNDAVHVRLTTTGSEAWVKFENRVSMPRAAIDFQVAGFFRAFCCVWASGAQDSVRVLFAHDAPADASEYTLTFGTKPVHFRAPFSGFAFHASCLDNRLVTAELRLHQVILDHAEQMLEHLPRAGQMTERVRNAIAEELAGGNPTVACVARRFHMSPRTLERKLDREGTTFSALLDDLRKRLALRYVGTDDLELAEIAFLLGFSQTTGFHRAFKRWTGETPLDYRRTQRRMPVPS